MATSDEQRTDRAFRLWALETANEPPSCSAAFSAGAKWHAQQAPQARADAEINPQIETVTAKWCAANPHMAADMINGLQCELDEALAANPQQIASETKEQK